MTLLVSTYTEVDQSQAEELTSTSERIYAVGIRPPRLDNAPATMEGFVRGLLELQTRIFGLKNSSPWISYEVHRPRSDRIRLQFCVPNIRLMRKVRTQLANQIPGVEFEPGVTTLPLKPDDSIGGAILTTGRDSRYPLETEFDTPPINSLVAGLHRHAMRDTKIVVQILFQPIVGRSLREWWRKRQTRKTVRRLRNDNGHANEDESPTPRERKQADAVEQKMGERRFWVTIRLAVIGAEEYTKSRIKEVVGSFNLFENPLTGQYFDTDTIRGVRQKRFLEFFQAIRDRNFGGYSLRFQATVPELAGLLSIPTREQDNLEYAL